MGIFKMYKHKLRIKTRVKTFKFANSEYSNQLHPEIRIYVNPGLCKFYFYVTDSQKISLPLVPCMVVCVCDW